MSHSANRPVTIVTAASRGLGRACAEELAHRGHALVLLSRTDDVASVARDLEAEHVKGSVTDPAALEETVALARTRYGRVDGLVNNTGHSAKGELLEISDDAWHEGLDLLLLNVVRAARVVAPVMEEQGGGAIVNISTFGAREPSLSFPVSSTLRAGLSAFTRLFARRYGPARIRMNNVLPGFVDTYPVDEEQLDEIPWGRPATTREVATAVTFLLSDESAFITGQDLLVDGGMVRGL